MEGLREMKIGDEVNPEIVLSGGGNATHICWRDVTQGKKPLEGLAKEELLDRVRLAFEAQAAAQGPSKDWSEVHV